MAPLPLMSSCLLLVASFLTSALAAPQQSFPVATNETIFGAQNSDPCGPPSQAPNTASTCSAVSAPAIFHKTYSTAPLGKSPPSVYGVNCLKDNSGEVLNYSSCMSNYEDLCYQLRRNPPRGQWLWSSGGPNCTFGVWLPVDKATSAPTPGYARCKTEILSLMAQWCGADNKGLSNVASVNLKALPSLTTTGKAVDPDYPSYIMVAQTYNDTSGEQGDNLFG